MNFKNIVNKEFEKAVMEDKEVIAMLVFGSYARSDSYRDIDICIVLDKKYSNLRMSKKRLKYTSLCSDKHDIHIFQQLPVYIRKRVLKDGKVVLCKNEDLLYEIAFSTIKEFNTYSKIYYNYIEYMSK